MRIQGTLMAVIVAISVPWNEAAAIAERRDDVVLLKLMFLKLIVQAPSVVCVLATC